MNRKVELLLQISRLAAELASEFRETAPADSFDEDIAVAEDSNETLTVSVPEKKPAPTLEQVRAVLADRSRSGHTDEIRDLLQKYGASRLSQVDPENYEALIKDAEELEDAG